MCEDIFRPGEFSFRMIDPFEGMQERQHYCEVHDGITLQGDSNLVYRKDRNGVQAMFRKPKEGDESSGKWILIMTHEILELDNVVTFKDGEVQIDNLSGGDYQTIYALKGADKCFEVIFPLN